MCILRGKVVRKYGDNINTNYIYPAKYLTITDPKEMGKHAMETYDPDFIKKVMGGGIVVAGKHFGCGPSMVNAPLTLKYAGAEAIIAEFFARIFYRNALNIGLPVIECLGVSQRVKEGDELELNFETGDIKNLTTGENLKGVAIPKFLLEIVKKGGLFPYLKEKYGER